MDKLPKVFQNPFDHNLDNDQRCYVSFNENNIVTRKNVSIEDIDEILNDKHHIFKPSVKLTTDGGVVNCKIVSRTKTDILTMDNKKISISSIKSIEII